ncbi:isoprenylcysteine carboxylmethyltransferase family protein [Thermococcus sp.]|uniref:methyltransferase family protein n=1 Tax=Thermococcus sp. TaxID=35749 RepID=UPI0026033517|nr:methyltransferase [Thermococcus sp.]
MEGSWRFRRFVFLVFATIPVISALVHYPAITGTAGKLMSIAGLVIMLVSGGIAVYVHSLFPKKHDRPEHFEKLLKDGPYRFVRHPFYSAFLFLGFGIALFFASVPGMIASLLMVPLWEKLAEIEERELLEYWGREYMEFMETRGRFLPRAESCPGRILLVFLIFLFGYFTLYGLKALFVNSYTVEFLIRAGVLLILTLGFVLFISKSLGIRAEFGLRRGEIWRSFLLASALSLPSPLLQLQAGSFHGFHVQTSVALIFLAYLLFAIYTFSVFVAFPIEVLAPCGRLWLIVPPLFLFVYDSYYFNAGKMPPLGDLILFVLLYPFVYMKTRNVAGIVLAYLLIAEWDPWWAFGIAYGWDAFRIAGLVRVGLSLLSAFVFLKIARTQGKL